MSLFKGERLVDTRLEGNTLVSGFPLGLPGNLPATTGNVYLAVNTANDTNAQYLLDKYAGITYSRGEPMVYTTIQAAIDKCVDWRGDIVLVGPRTWVITTPILFNKKGITVAAPFDIGAGQDNGERTTIDIQATANLAAAVISEPAYIYGLGFSSANPATTGQGPTGSPGAVYGGTIVMGAGNGFDGGNFTTIRSCRFTNWGHAGAGIDSWSNDFVKVIDCDFDGTINGAGNSANVFANGIVFSNGHYNTVENCTFRGCTFAIRHGNSNPADSAHSNANFVYKGNRVMVAGGTEKFLHFNTLATYSLSYGLVADNWFGTATDTATYSDTVATAKTNKVTFSGNHYSE